MIHEFARSCRVKVAAKQLADLGGFCVELLDKAPGVVAVADQSGFEVVELTRENSLDDACVDRSGPDLEPGLERAHEVLADLEGSLEFGREACRRLIGDDIIRGHALVE